MKEVLIFSIYLCFIAIGSVWFLIGTSLFFKSRKYKRFKRIELIFSEIVGQHLYGKGNTSRSVKGMKRAFSAVGINASNPQNVQRLIDLMIHTQRMLLGTNHEKLKLLYPQLPPYNESIKKVRSRYWYKKARGIREIYEMNQSQYLKEIIALRNHKNLYVRREAQIALVVFLGWKSLRFLPYLKQNITLWQQIKIVEKLHDLYPNPDTEVLRNAYDIKKGYGKELLMRIIRKFDIVEEIDYIIGHLSHPDHEVRETALYCLSSFQLTGEQVERVKFLFNFITTPEQQETTLKLLNQWVKEIDATFYVKLLTHQNDSVKLNAAEILWNRGYQDKVEEFYYSQYTK